MARVRDYVALTQEPTIPVPDHEVGDIVIALYGRTGGFTPVIPAGWIAFLSPSTAVMLSNGVRATAYWQRVAGTKLTSIPLPQAVPGANVTTVGISITGVDGTTAFDSAVSIENVTTGVGVGGHIGSVTTGNPNSLICSLLWHYDAGYGGQPAPGIIRDGAVEGVNGMASQFHHWYGGAAGVQAAHDFVSFRLGIPIWAITFALLDDGADQRTGDVARSPAHAEIVFPHGWQGYGGPMGTGGISDIDVSAAGTNLVPTLGGVTTEQRNGWVDSVFDVGPSLSHGDINSGSVTNNVVITGTERTNAIDLSNSLVAILHQGSPKANDNSPAKIWGIGNDTTNWARFWQVDARNYDPNGDFGNYRPTIIDTADASFVYEDVGAIDLTDVTMSIAGGLLDSGSSGNLGYGPAALLRTLSLKGGSTSSPANLADAAAAASSWRLDTVIQQGSTQFGARQPFSFGDGATVTTLNIAGQSLEFPPARAVPRNAEYQIPQARLTCDFNGTATCDLSPAGATFPMGDFHVWGPDAGRIAGQWRTDGCTVYDATPRLNSIVATPAAGLAMVGCKQVTYTTLQDLSGGGSLFESCVDPIQISVANQADLSKIGGWEFRNCDRCIEIFGDQAGTLTLPADMDFSTGNTFAITYGGTTDFNLSVPPTSLSVTVENTGAGTCTLIPASAVAYTNLDSNAEIYLAAASPFDVLIDESATADDLNRSVPIGNGGFFIETISRWDEVAPLGPTARLRRVDVVTGNSIGKFVQFEPDPVRVQRDSVAALIPGITIDSGLAQVIITGTVTGQQFYDFQGQWGNDRANHLFAAPLAPGATAGLFQLASEIIEGSPTPWTVEIQSGGSLIMPTTELLGTVSVLPGGLFEDSTGVEWNDGGTVRLMRRVNRRYRSATTEANLPGVVVAAWDGTEELTYSLALAAGAVTTDAGGVATFYAAYNVAAVAKNPTERASLYKYAPGSLTLEATGTAVGTSPAPADLFLLDDAFAPLSAVAAAAVSGVTVTQGSTLLDAGGNDLSDTMCNLKVRLASVDDIETGTPGYVMFNALGDWLLADNGSVFQLNSAWLIRNLLDAVKTLRGGTIEVDTPGNVDLNLADLTIQYATASPPNYNHRGKTMNGTITLRTTGALAVTAEFDPIAVNSGLILVNDEPGNIDIDRSAIVEPVIRINVSDAWQGDPAAYLDAYYLDGAAGLDFNTVDAVAVRDRNAQTVTFGAADAQGVAGAYYVEFTYGYNTDSDAGLPISTDKDIVLVAGGDGGCRFATVNSQITGTPNITIDVLCAAETN